MTPEARALLEASPAAFFAKYLGSGLLNPESLSVMLQQAKGNIGGIAVTDDGHKGPSITVEEFLFLRKSLPQQAPGSPEAKAMEEARLYYVPPMLYAAAYHEADVWSEQSIWGQEWVPFDHMTPELDDGEDTDHAEYLNRLRDAAKRMEVPPLPFAQTFIGFGSGITIPPMHLEMRGGGLEDAEYGKLFGMLLDAEEGIWEAMRLYYPDGTVATAMYPVWKDRAWRENVCMNLTPWVVPCLIKAIETSAHPVSRLVGDRAAKKLKKETGVVSRPPRFYSVKVSPTEAKDLARQVVGAGFARSLSYRFDVRGHWRLLIKRSTETLYQKERFSLEARGYTVGTSFRELGPDLAQALADRNVPDLRDGEWIAAKLVRVKEHKKGPEDAPYVPAIREA